MKELTAAYDLVLLPIELAVSWEALIAYDSFIFALLLLKIFEKDQARFPVASRSRRLSLRILLIRDGKEASTFRHAYVKYIALGQGSYITCM